MPLLSTATVTGMSRHFKLMDGFHAQVRKGHYPGTGNRPGNQVGGAADSRQVDRTMFLYGRQSFRAALRLADHADQSCPLQHQVGELVHPGCGGGARRTDDLIPDSIDRTHVVDEAVVEVNSLGQWFTLLQQAVYTFVRGIPAGQQFTAEQQGFTGPPISCVSPREYIQVDAAGTGTGLPAYVGPVIEAGGFLQGRSAAVQGEMRMAGGGAVGDQGYGQGCRMGGIVDDLHVQRSSQAAQALGADSQVVDPVEDFQAQFFQPRLRIPLFQLLDVYGFEQRFLCQYHRLLGRAADPYPENARRTPAGAKGRHHVHDPVGDAVAGVQHRHFCLVFGTPALRSKPDFHLVSRYHFHMDDRRCVVTGVFAGTGGIGHDGGAQHIIRVGVGAPDALVDHIGDTRPCLIPTDIHTDFNEYRDYSGILANGTMPLRAHPGIDQDLRQCVFCRRGLFPLPGTMHRGDKILRMVVGNELQRIRNAVDQVIGFDSGHGDTYLARSGYGDSITQALKMRVVT